MDPEVKKILNKLKCPVCGAQIDLIGYALQRKGYNFACAFNVDHYAICLEYDPARITKHCVHIYDADHKYEIIKSPIGDMKTSIKVFTTDAESRVIFSFKKKELDLEQDFFNFDSFNAEKAINRIKIIFAFY